VRQFLVFCAAAALLAAAAPSADAESSLNPCQGQALSQPFLPWLDTASYTLAPNGGFEQGSGGWTLSDGAALAAGNETSYVHAASDASSLHLPSGSSATSSPLCVSILHPDLRLFVRNSGFILSGLRVEVLYTDVVGIPRSALISSFPATSSWQPTLPLPILVNLTALPLLTNGATRVAFCFTAGSGGDFWIDDVYVDPYQGR
jgi:hypothetical protein